jgi:hypothetical protein
LGGRRAERGVALTKTGTHYEKDPYR